MKGKIPNTAEMILESSEAQWRLLSQQTINKLETSAIIELPSKRIRLQLIIKKIIPPENSQTIITCQVQSNNNQEVNTGLMRISNFLTNKLENNKWIFIGEIVSDKLIPIIIIHYTLLEKTIYSIKLQSDNLIHFSPNFLNN